MHHFNITWAILLIFLCQLSTLYFRDWKMILWTQNPSTGRALNKPSAALPSLGGPELSQPGQIVQKHAEVNASCGSREPKLEYN